MDENFKEIQKYCNKLLLVIDNKTSFSLFGKKFVNKKNIDNIICCIESCLPEVYKTTLKITPYKVPSYRNFTNLVAVISKNFQLNNNLYVINRAEVEKNIKTFLSSIRSDFKSITNDNLTNF